MDPFSALVISMLFTYFLVRNTTQDLVFKATGKMPPSYLREQERIKRRKARKPLTERRAARKFFANAWADAWESAYDKWDHTQKERRRRRLDKRELIEEIERAHGEAHRRNTEYDRQWEQERSGRHRRDDPAPQPAAGGGQRPSGGDTGGAGTHRPGTPQPGSDGPDPSPDEATVDLGGFDTATVIRREDGCDEQEARAKAVAAVAGGRMKADETSGDDLDRVIGDLAENSDVVAWADGHGPPPLDGPCNCVTCHNGKGSAATPPATAQQSQPDGQTAGDNTDGGTPVESQGYEGDRQSFSDAEQKLGTAVQGMEDQMAGMLADGMGNDPETMGHLAAAQEGMQNTQAQFAAAQRSMGKHESGREYATSGHAAKTEYLQDQ